MRQSEPAPECLCLRRPAATRSSPSLLPPRRGGLGAPSRRAAHPPAARPRGLRLAEARIAGGDQQSGSARSGGGGPGSGKQLTRVRRQRGARREAAEVRGALGSGWGCAAREDGDHGAATATGVGSWRGREPYHLLPGAGVRLASPAPSLQRWDLCGEGDGIRTQFFLNYFPEEATLGRPGETTLRIRYGEGIRSGEQGTHGDFLSLDLRWDKTGTPLCGALHFPEPSSEQLF